MKDVARPVGHDLHRVRHWLACVALAVLSAPVVAGPGPLSEQAVALYPGATEISDDKQPEQGPHIRSTYLKKYQTHALPEEVFAFYQKRFGSVPAEGELQTPAAGSASVVRHDISYHTFEDVMEAGEGKKKQRDLAKSKRKPHQPGRWIGVVYFDWTKVDTNGERSDFQVVVWDGGTVENAKFKPDTQITVQRITYKSDQALDEETDAAEAHAHAAKVKQLAGTALRPADVGVPEYPGAKLDTETSAMLRSSMAINTVAYRTTDPVQKVAAFYQKQRDLRPAGAVTAESAAFSGGCKEEYIAVMKKKIVTGCDVEVGIQNPWMNLNTGKKMKDTLITITKQSE